MTIRQQVRKRIRNAGLAAFALVSLAIILRTWLFPAPEYQWLEIVAFAIGPIVVFYIRYFIECPKCFNPLGIDAFPVAFPTAFFWSPPRNFCQSCGKSFDEAHPL